MRRDKVQCRVVTRVLAGFEVADLFFVLGETVGCESWIWSDKVKEEREDNKERCTYADAAQGITQAGITAKLTSFGALVRQTCDLGFECRDAVVGFCRQFISLWFR